MHEHEDTCLKHSECSQEQKNSSPQRYMNENIPPS